MSRLARRALIAAGSLVALAAAAGGANAQSLQVTTPNVDNTSGATSVTTGGVTYVNGGIQGVGRIPATTRDFNGESFGAFSGMTADASTWRRNTNGTYTGTLFAIPDRGPNGVGPIVGTTAFQNRVEVLGMTFTPYTSTTTTTPTQLGLVLNSGFFLRDATGVTFTGKDAGAGTITRGGITYPMPASGEGAGHISMDSEAITRLRDGTFYVSDEYAAGIYYFGADGVQLGGIQATPALLPRTGGVINFNGDNPPDTGRRNNQGLEAITVTPDQKRLVTVLQSATIQDNPSGQDQNRNNTRIVVYDISATRTPTAPVAEFILQLPITRNSGNGGAPDKTAAQSEALALNGHQFLILSRDGNGRGNGSTRPEVFRSVILVDTAGATNIAGTSYSNSTTPVVVGGACNAVTDARGCLLPAITPVSVTQLVNIINPTQLGRFGLNTNTNPSDFFSVSEKLEGMVLLPVLEEAHPQDFFLLVGNDNDFETTNGLVNGFAFDASLSGAGGTGVNEPTILVYRLTLPTYVDAEALASMVANGPLVMAAESETAFGFAETASGPAMEQLSLARREAMAGGQGYADGVQVWASGQWNQVESREPAGPPLGVDGGGVAFGVDTGFHGARFGIAAGYQKLAGDFGAGSDLAAKGWGLAVYAGWMTDDFYAQASYGALINLDFGSIDRPAAYGLTASAETTADARIFEAEGGWRPRWGAVRFGPFINLRHAEVNIDGYTETGAALGNVVYPDRKVTRASGTVGLELDGQFGQIIPSARVAYTFMSEGAPDQVAIRLASAQDVMGTQTVTVPSTAAGYFSAGLGLQGGAGPVDWRASVEARFGNGATDVRAGVGAAFRF